MRKIYLVARREYLYNLRRRSFLFGAFGVPIFVIIVMVIAFTLASRNEDNIDSVGQVGYVDQSGVLAGSIDRPDFFVPYETEDAARLALDQQQIGAYFVVPENYLASGNVRLYTSNSLPDALNDRMDDFLRVNIAARLDTLLPVERLKDPVDLTIQVQDSGRSLTSDQIASLFFTPIIFVIVFAMSSQITSGFLMAGVVEEKTNRIMEILVTSITPMQLLAGKIIGLGVLGLTQLLIWAIGGAVTLALARENTFLSGISFPLDIVVVSAIYFILAYFLLASVMAGIGAVVGSEQESRQIAGIASLVLFLPFFVIVTFITDPNGTLPTILTLIPFTAPISAILRMSFGAIPAWQLVASILILLGTTILVAWISSRVFRWALLLYGKRPGLRELWRVIRQPSRIETTVSRTEGSR